MQYSINTYHTTCSKVCSYAAIYTQSSMNMQWFYAVLGQAHSRSKGPLQYELKYAKSFFKVGVWGGWYFEGGTGEKGGRYSTLPV